MRTSWPRLAPPTSAPLPIGALSSAPGASDALQARTEFSSERAFVIPIASAPAPVVAVAVTEEAAPADEVSITVSVQGCTADDSCAVLGEPTRVFIAVVDQAWLDVSITSGALDAVGELSREPTDDVYEYLQIVSSLDSVESVEEVRQWPEVRPMSGDPTRRFQRQPAGRPLHPKRCMPLAVTLLADSPCHFAC